MTNDKNAAIIDDALKNMDIQKELIKMLDYGKPSLSFVNKGWHCGIEMNTNSKGSTFNVRSEFDHDSPAEAIRVCKLRAKAAIKTIKETK